MLTTRNATAADTHNKHIPRRGIHQRSFSKADIGCSGFAIVGHSASIAKFEKTNQIGLASRSPNSHLLDLVRNARIKIHEPATVRPMVIAAAGVMKIVSETKLVIGLTFEIRGAERQRGEPKACFWPSRLD